MAEYENKNTPKSVFDEYGRGTRYKNSIGRRGVAEQAKINERMFVGDQWYGAKCGNDRPLVRRNVIKRIGEYKIAMITSAPVSVQYSADGVPSTMFLCDEVKKIRRQLASGGSGEPVNADIRANVVMSALSDYFNTTAERVKLENKKLQVLKDAYISGTGLLYTYWDPETVTGLYADEGRTRPIRGDINCEVLDIENVVFGDPDNTDIQSQPYIIFSQSLWYDDVVREAEMRGLSENEIENIKPETDTNGAKRVTVLTKLYKEYLPDGTHRVMAVKVCRGAVLREEWDLRISLYPVSKFVWEQRKSCIYGDSEITSLIPNQIAINRALTAEIWGMMLSGMPIMLVNGDVVRDGISNDPGQVIKVYGESALDAVKYLTPPDFASQCSDVVNGLAVATLTDSGANEAALGDIRPDNAAAIIATREAATMPMQVHLNRFYDFIEDTARIWADFWIRLYGARSLKVHDENGIWFIPFNGDECKNLPIVARIDVGPSTIYAQSQIVSTLDGLLREGVITHEQYLKRVPKGLIPDVTGLLEKAGKEAVK